MPACASGYARREIALRLKPCRSRRE